MPSAVVIAIIFGLWFFQGWQGRLVGGDHIKRHQVDLPLAVGQRVHVLQFPDVVGVHPTPLPGGGICFVAGLNVAAEQAVNQVFAKIRAVAE